MHHRCGRYPASRHASSLRHAQSDDRANRSGGPAAGRAADAGSPFDDQDLASSRRSWVPFGLRSISLCKGRIGCPSTKATHDRIRRHPTFLAPHRNSVYLTICLLHCQLTYGRSPRIERYAQRELRLDPVPKHIIRIHLGVGSCPRTGPIFRADHGWATNFVEVGITRYYICLVSRCESCKRTSP